MLADPLAEDGTSTVAGGAVSSCFTYAAGVVAASSAVVTAGDATAGWAAALLGTLSGLGVGAGSADTGCATLAAGVAS